MRIPSIAIAAGAIGILLGLASLAGGMVLPALVLFPLSIAVMASMRMAWQYERAIVTRFGSFERVSGPGFFMVMPFVNDVLDYVDTRIQCTEIKAELALTRDAVPVNVDAIVFWQTHDPKKATLEVRDFRKSIGRVAQTSLREMIGSSDLSRLLSDRKNADQELRSVIADKIEDWGNTVTSVEIRDVSIPASLNDAMSRQAQAEREKSARVTLASAELEIAEKTAQAAQVYADHPIALELRKMGLVYEMGKNGTTILVPTDLAGVMGNTAVAAATARSLVAG